MKRVRKGTTTEKLEVDNANETIERAVMMVIMPMDGEVVFVDEWRR